MVQIQDKSDIISKSCTTKINRRIHVKKMPNMCNTHETSMQYTLNKHAIHMQCTLNKHAIHKQHTLHKLATYIHMQVQHIYTCNIYTHAKHMNNACDAHATHNFYK